MKTDDSVNWSEIETFELKNGRRLTCFGNEEENYVPKFVIYTSDHDSIGRVISSPKEMTAESFLKDSKGLSKHMEECCHGEETKMHLSHSDRSYCFMYDQFSRGEIVMAIGCETYPCQSKYYDHVHFFEFDQKQEKWVYKPTDRDEKILVERMWWQVNFEFEYAKNGLCEGAYSVDLAWYSLDQYHQVYINHKDNEHCTNVELPVSIDDIFDMEGLNKHNCCVKPSMMQTLICKKMADKNNVDYGDLIKLGRLDNFTVRCFPFYSIDNPRPDCHDQYQNFFYIDLVYDKKTKSFIRHDVKYDPVKHKNVKIPLD